MQLEDNPTKYSINNLIEWMDSDDRQTGRELYPELEAALGGQRPLDQLVLTVRSATGFWTRGKYGSSLHLCHIVVHALDLDWPLW